MRVWHARALALRGKGAVLRPRNRPVTVARGPVPRDRPYQEGSVVAPPGAITTETDL